KLNGRDESPWQEMRNGHGINDRLLASYLKPFGITSRSVRVGEAHRKGYLAEDFRGCWNRYCAPTQRRGDKRDERDAFDNENNFVPAVPAVPLSREEGLDDADSPDECPHCGGGGCEWCEPAPANDSFPDLPSFLDRRGRQGPPSPKPLTP